MIEVILLLLGIAGIFSVACSIALIALGKIIDTFPVGDEATRTRSLGSPTESTKLAVIFFWALFILGGWAVLQESRFVLIVGITTLFAACLFMFTALVFSFAVLSTMKHRKKAFGDTVLHAAMAPPNATALLPQAAPEAQPATTSRRGNRHVPGFMVEVLLKKD
jgi:hypothetical protein